jgi:hypothetical protein
MRKEKACKKAKNLSKNKNFFSEARDRLIFLPKTSKIEKKNIIAR